MAGSFETPCQEEFVINDKLKSFTDAGLCRGSITALLRNFCALCAHVLRAPNGSGPFVGVLPGGLRSHRITLGLVLVVLLARDATAQLPPIPPDHTSDRGGVKHAPGMVSPFANNCTDCHGQRLGGASARSCFVCHFDYNLNGGDARPDRWNIPNFNAPSTPAHDNKKKMYWHARNKDLPYQDHCTDCHGPTLYGGIGPSCYQCHGVEWTDSGPATPPVDHNVDKNGVKHKPGYNDPYASDCTSCHGLTLNDPYSFVPSCYDCHDNAAGTPHDFSGRAWLDPAESSCTPCHDWGTWNHALSPTTGYTISDTLIANDLGDPNGVSQQCMGCHEGNVAVDSYLGKTGSEFITGNAAFGTDLTTHHPVSYTYDTALATVHGALHDPAVTSSGLPAGGTIAQDMLDANGQLQCRACHDQHDNTLGKFLVNTIDALCFTCHTKQLPGGTRGMHHIPLRSDPWRRGQCTLCHGTNLDGVGGSGPACTTCHQPFNYPDPPGTPHHGDDRYRPYRNCDLCHGDDLKGAVYGTITAPSCNQCHGDVWVTGNQPPTADAGGPYSIDISEAVIVDASASTDPEGDSLTYIWDFGDGNPPRRRTLQPMATHTYAANGIYNGTLTVGDGYNPPVSVPFTVEVTGTVSTEDIWSIITTGTAPESFLITIEDHDGVLVVLKDDGVNPTTLAIGAEFPGVIFWMDIWMDFTGNITWGTGATYFGNINRVKGVMSGVTFSDTGGVSIFTGQKL